MGADENSHGREATEKVELRSAGWGNQDSPIPPTASRACGQAGSGMPRPTLSPAGL